MKSAGVLIIDDDPHVLRTLSPALGPTYEVTTAATGEEGLAQYERLRPDIVLLDLMLPQMGGLAVLRALKRWSADLPVIMMTGYAEVQTAVQAIKLGALDYLQKPLDHESVLQRIQHAVDRPAIAEGSALAGLIGESAAMRRIWRSIERFGPTELPILLQGETGTGKGLVAEAIHQTSLRRSGPFVAIDCATIPHDLAESELFGYEDGAFTGAGRRKRGRVAFADKGTLFLDEIGTLSVSTQSKLLTLLERQSFAPLGARDAQLMHLDARFVSATNVPLQDGAENGSFRSDLYHRLNGITIDLPPLRDRGADVVLLTRHFVAAFGRREGKRDLDISDEALALLQSYRWPGNIRELQRVIWAAVIVSSGAITPDDLPSHVRLGAEIQKDVAEAEAASRVPGPPPPGALNLREIKEWAGREAQKRVIQELQGRTNITRQELAHLLGVDAKTLRSRMKEMSGGVTLSPPGVAVKSR